MVVHYNKGALALYALKDAVGEDVVNRALARFKRERRLRSDPATADIPILSVSSNWYLAVEADAALAKPYQRTELLAVAERLLREGRGTP